MQSQTLTFQPTPNPYPNPNPYPDRLSVCSVLLWTCTACTALSKNKHEAAGGHRDSKRTNNILSKQAKPWMERWSSPNIIKHSWKRIPLPSPPTHTHTHTPQCPSNHTSINNSVALIEMHQMTVTSWGASLLSPLFSSLWPILDSWRSLLPFESGFEVPGRLAPVIRRASARRARDTLR